MVLRAIDVWIAKELLFYAVVVITFLMIMMEQGSNAIIYSIAGGVFTFVILFWWRTTQSDHLEALRPKDKKEMKQRE